MCQSRGKGHVIIQGKWKNKAEKWKSETAKTLALKFRSLIHIELFSWLVKGGSDCILCCKDTQL